MYPYYQARDNYPPYDPNAGYPPQQPGFQPGYPPQPGYPQPSYPQQPQYGAPSQPGYPTQSGYGDAYAQPGYPTQQAGYNQYVDPRYQNMYNNIPPSMPLQPLTGKKKAVLIGINCKFHFSKYNYYANRKIMLIFRIFETIINKNRKWNSNLTLLKKTLELHPH